MRMLNLAAILMLTAVSSQAAENSLLIFKGLCDGSAAIALSAQEVVVAGDDDNILRVFPITGGDSPSRTVDLTAVLGNKEADLEAVALFDDMLVWVGSHGRNTDGERREAREVMMAISKSSVMAGQLNAVELSRSPARLRDGLLAYAQREGNQVLGLVKALGTDKSDKNITPEAGGINIEAFAYNPNTSLAYLGFRNPRPGGKALLLPLLNLGAVLENKAPNFGSPVLLDLGGRGLRDMAYQAAQQTLLLLAGTSGPGENFTLFRWDGGVPIKIQDVTSIHPEAIVPLPNSSDILLLSDDGDMQASTMQADCKNGEFRDGSCTCKNIRNSRTSVLRQFRGVRLTVH